MIKDKYKDFKRLVDEGSLTPYEYIMVELMRDIRDSLVKPGTLESVELIAEKIIPLKKSKKK